MASAYMPLTANWVSVSRTINSDCVDGFWTTVALRDLRRRPRLLAVGWLVWGGGGGGGNAERIFAIEKALRTIFIPARVRSGM